MFSTPTTVIHASDGSVSVFEIGIGIQNSRYRFGSSVYRPKTNSRMSTAHDDFCYRSVKFVEFNLERNSSETHVPSGSLLPCELC